MTLTPTGATRPRITLAVVVLAQALLIIDITIVTVGLPQIQVELGGSLAGIQWVVAGYALTFAALTQPAGSLADRFSRRTVYATGIAIFTVASLLAGLAESVLVLDAMRVLQGVGAALVMGNSLALIAQAYEGQRRNMAIAIFSTVLTVAGVAAPILGGLLITLSWRWMFLINVPLGVVAFVLAVVCMPAYRSTAERARIDWLGAGLLIVAFGMVNFALLRGQDQGWGSAATLAQLAVGAAAFALFVLVERRAAAPTVDLTLFRVPTFAAITGLAFVSRLATIGGTVYFVYWFQAVLGLTALQSGLMLLPVFAAQTAAGLGAAKLQSRIGPGRLIATGYVLKGAAALGMALVVAPDASIVALVLALVVWGTGGGIAGTPTMSTAMNVVPKEKAGMASGTVMSMFSFGVGVGTPILGAVFVARIDAVVSGSTELPAGSHEAIAHAAAQVDLDAVAAATPPGSAAVVQDLLGRAISSGTSAVMLTTAVLAGLAAVVALRFVRRNDLAVHSADQQDAPRKVR